MITNLEVWEKQVEVNTDPYGKAVVDVAREVMRLLDTDEYKEFDCHDIICKADTSTNAGGVTGFMATCVVQIITHCHSRGEEFRKRWNGEWGNEKAEGIVNPAVLTVDTSKL